MNEETFVRELQRRADDVHGAPLSLDDVRGTARSIRRRRRATAAAAAAAAVAVVAVVPATLSGHLGRAEGPAPATHDAHTAVLHDGTVTMPDGGSVDIGVDNADVVDYGVLTDGRVVVALMKPYAVEVFSADGSLQERYPVQSNVVTMGPSDHLAAWVGKDFRIQVLESGVADPVALPGIPDPGDSVGMVDAVLGSGCADGGCSAYLGDGATTTSVSTSGATEAEDLRTSEPLRIDDVSPDGSLWAVSFPPAPGEQYGCSGLYDPDADRVVARTCDTSGLQFAPDGKHLTGARGDNRMYGEVDVLDERLERVSGFSTGGAAISAYAWDGPDHLLVATVTLDDNRWTLRRVGLDEFGRVTPDNVDVVAGPVPGRNPEMLSEFLFSQ